MEDNVQRVFAILIAVIIFFLLPMYISFEKKDDISYALALKITSNFVDTVTQKGYLSKDMYDKYISDLAISDNHYEIFVEHVAKRYYPVINKYKNEFKKDSVVNNEIEGRYDYLKYANAFNKIPDKNGYINFNGNDIKKNRLQIDYELFEEKYNLPQIINVLSQADEIEVDKRIIYKDLKDDAYKALTVDEIPVIPNMYGTKEKTIYTMNKGDMFTVVIRNKNVTFATILFNSMTFGVGANNTTKVYINYGSTVKNEEYKLNDKIESPV